MSYQIHEFTPYEGYGIFDVETLEELKQKLEELLDDRRSIWGFRKEWVHVYEVVREIPIKELLG